MSFENFPKPNMERGIDKKEERPERVLSPDEIKQLGEGMAEFAEGLRVIIDEIKEKLEVEEDAEKRAELERELEEAQEQYEGLQGFIGDIDSGNFEEITGR